MVSVIVNLDIKAGHVAKVSQSLTNIIENNNYNIQDLYSAL